MNVSVIIPTYNGAHKIVNILHALSQQTYKDFEIIIVIDGSTDNTKEVIVNFIESAGCIPIINNIRIIEQANGGRAVSRNRGAKEASGDLLIFFDDDVRPVAECISIHSKHHLDFFNSILVGNVPEDMEKMRTDFQKYKAFLSHKWTVPLATANDSAITKYPYLTAANFSIKRQCFFDLGGFDERLTDAEDFDLAVRAYLGKIPIHFIQGAIAWHDDFITCRSYIKRLRQYKVANDKLEELKPDLIKSFRVNNQMTRRFIKSFIYTILSQKLFVDLVDDAGLLKILPKTWRYKLYDLITTGLAIYYPDRLI